MSTSRNDDGDPGDERAEGSHALAAEETFERLGNETRVAILETLLDDGDANDELAFSDLHEAVGTPTSAGFAYHLRQLTDHYVQKTDDGYRLTYAGRRVARAVVAGTYTERTDTDAIDVEDACPVCGERSLTARCVDNVVAIECADHGDAIATIPLPPGGSRRTLDADLLWTVDRHHRRRVALVTDGTCPECAGPVTAALSSVPPPGTDDRPGDRGDERSSDPDDQRSTDAKAIEDGSEKRAQFRFECGDCGRALRSPVAFAVVDHPAVVGFCHDHGVDVRERPLWNLGEEWSETVLSTEPWCVRVSVRLDGDRLDVLVGEGPTIHVLDESATVDRSTTDDQSSAASKSS